MIPVGSKRSQPESGFERRDDGRAPKSESEDEVGELSAAIEGMAAQQSPEGMEGEVSADPRQAGAAASDVSSRSSSPVPMELEPLGSDDDVREAGPAPLAESALQTFGRIPQSVLDVIASYGCSDPRDQNGLVHDMHNLSTPHELDTREHREDVYARRYTRAIEGGAMRLCDLPEEVQRDHPALYEKLKAEAAKFMRPEDLARQVAEYAEEDPAAQHAVAAQVLASLTNVGDAGLSDRVLNVIANFVCNDEEEGRQVAAATSQWRMDAVDPDRHDVEVLEVAYRERFVPAIRDGSVDLSELPPALRRRFPQLYEELSLLAIERGVSLRKVNALYRTPAVCLAAVRKRPSDFQHVPLPVRAASPEMCWLAVEADARAIGDVPRTVDNYAAVWKLALQRNPDIEFLFSSGYGM